jgi:hypothetical protein
MVVDFVERVEVKVEVEVEVENESEGREAIKTRYVLSQAQERN